MITELEDKILRLAVQKSILTQEHVQQIDAEITMEATAALSGKWSPRIELLIRKGILDEQSANQLKAEVLGSDEKGALEHPTLRLDDITFYHASQAGEGGLNGKPFGRYRDLQFLGSGGMAQVYRAFDPTLDRAVALKFLRMDHPVLAERLMTEARNQARIEHENVCKVYEVGRVSNIPYIAMQYINGQTLRSMISLLRTEQKIRIMAQVCDAVHAAHRVGLIHRDLKPSNIMVEQKDDGEMVPYVMDFGIAREVNSEGLTMEGTVIGSAWYMPPEQAKGEIQNLDRRSDVYSLGATMYELLCGKLPFETRSSVETLLKVINEDPIPLIRQNPRISSDLNTIVAKCMEKEPSQRYDSARALAEDLGRFLEGEPVLATSSGITYRLYKKARKNRALTATISIALLLVLFMAGWLLRAQWKAQQQVEFAQQMAFDVAKMENIMRTAVLRPLHDIAIEKRKVRTLMSEIESRMRRAGKIATGPGNYALGRGYLILNELPRSREALEAAWENGFQQPETAYALGLVFGKLYEKELAEVVRIGNAEQREIQKKRIQDEYRTPALMYLQKGHGAESESPEYVQALIASYEGNWEVALKKAEQGHRIFPEIYEFDLLKADIHRILANLASKKGEFAEAQKQFDLADQYFRKASDFARSDSRAYGGLCELWSDVVEMKLYGEGGDVTPYINQSLDACTTAIAADSENSDNFVGESYVYRYQAEFQMNSGQDAHDSLEKAIRSGKQAVKLDPKNGRAHSALATAALYQAESEIGKGQDPGSYLDLAIREAKAAVPLIARPTTAYNIMANAYADLGDYQMAHGEDPQESYKSAASGYQQALKISPKFTAGYNNIASVYRGLAQFQARRGSDPSEYLRKAVENTAMALRYKPNDAYPHTEAGQCYNELARYAIDMGRDPGESVNRAIEHFQAAAKINPDYYLSFLHLAETYRLAATHKMLAGQNPVDDQENARIAIRQSLQLNPNSAAGIYESALIHLNRAEYLLMTHSGSSDELQAAESNLAKVLELDPLYAQAYMQQTMIALMQARGQMARGGCSDSSLKASGGKIAKALELNPSDPEGYAVLAEYNAVLADCILLRKMNPEAIVGDGFSAAARALEMRGNWAEPFAIRAMLYLVAARSTDSEESRREQMQKASESLQKAFELNPLLRVKYKSVETAIGTLR